MKKLISMILICALAASSFTVFGAVDASEIGALNNNSAENTAAANPNDYDEIILLEASIATYGFVPEKMSSTEFNELAQANIEKARSALLALDLTSQGLAYIEDACLEELESLSTESECILNEYAILVPKVRSATPSYFAQYSGRDYYTAVVSRSNITVQKNSSFATANNLRQWSQAIISLGLCFSGTLQVTIPWAILTSSLPSKYTVHTTDWMDSYINLNPQNRAIYVKNGSEYINVANREFGAVRPYFVYHYNDANVSRPADVVYSQAATYPDATSGAAKENLLYMAKQVYDSGANPVSYKLSNIADLLWR